MSEGGVVCQCCVVILSAPCTYIRSSPLGVTMTGLMNRKMKNPPMRDWQYSGDASGNFSYVCTYIQYHTDMPTQVHTQTIHHLSPHNIPLHSTLCPTPHSTHNPPHSPHSTSLPHTSHPTVYTSQSPLHTVPGTLHLHKHTNSFA